jgi:hypothetical protein
MRDGIDSPLGRLADVRRGIEIGLTYFQSGLRRARSPPMLGLAPPLRTLWGAIIRS